MTPNPRPAASRFRRLAGPLAAALAVVLLAAPALAQSRHSRNALIERGRTLVNENCANCHAIGRTGLSEYRGAPPFRDLWRRYPIDVLEEALAEGFTSGHPAMPEFVFSADHAAAIVAYLESVQTGQPRRR